MAVANDTDANMITVNNFFARRIKEIDTGRDAGKPYRLYQLKVFSTVKNVVRHRNG